MRLIDADALLYVISPAVEPGGKVYDPDIPAHEMREYIRNMPEIEAIPIDWVREKMKRPQATCANPFGFVLAEWLEEQED